MALSTAVKVRRDGTITLTSGDPVTLTIDYEDGNFSMDNLSSAGKADRVVIRDRGSIVGLRKGDDVVGSLGFSVHFREFTNASVGTHNLLDFLNGQEPDGAGSYQSLVSTGSSGFEQFLCTVKIDIEGTDLGDGADGSATMLLCALTADFSEGDPDILNVSGEVYGAVSYTGTVS